MYDGVDSVGPSGRYDGAGIENAEVEMVVGVESANIAAKFEPPGANVTWSKRAGPVPFASSIAPFPWRLPSLRSWVNSIGFALVPSAISRPHEDLRTNDAAGSVTGPGGSFRVVDHDSGSTVNVTFGFIWTSPVSS